MLLIFFFLFLFAIFKYVTFVGEVFATFINRCTSFYLGKKTKWWIHRWIWGKKWVNVTLLSVHKETCNKWRKTCTKTCHKVTPVWRFEKCIKSILWMAGVHTSVKCEWFWSQMKLVPMDYNTVQPWSTRPDPARVFVRFWEVSTTHEFDIALWLNQYYGRGWTCYSTLVLLRTTSRLNKI